MKEEPNVQDEEESDENWEQLKAYPPLPSGVIKEEFQSGDEHDEFNFGMQVIQLYKNEFLISEIQVKNE